MLEIKFNAVILILRFTSFLEFKMQFAIQDIGGTVARHKSEAN